MYLFDTDTLSNVVKPRPSKRLLEKLKKLPADTQFTTAINIGEIYFGARRSPSERRILDAFEKKVFPTLTVLPFDRESGVVFGRLKAETQKRGIGCSEPDLRIATIAIQHGFTLITGNTRHFQPIPGLQFENWIE